MNAYCEADPALWSNSVFQLGIGTAVLQLNRLRGWVVTECQSRDYSNPEFLVYKVHPVTCVHKN